MIPHVTVTEQSPGAWVVTVNGQIVTDPEPEPYTRWLATWIEAALLSVRDLSEFPQIRPAARRIIQSALDAWEAQS